MSARHLCNNSSSVASEQVQGGELKRFEFLSFHFQLCMCWSMLNIIGHLWLSTFQNVSMNFSDKLEKEHKETTWSNVVTTFHTDAYSTDSTLSYPSLRRRVWLFLSSWYWEPRRCPPHLEQRPHSLHAPHSQLWQCNETTTNIGRQGDLAEKNWRIIGCYSHRSQGTATKKSVQVIWGLTETIPVENDAVLNFLITWQRWPVKSLHGLLEIQCE
jgi:hypothetical protein